MNIKNMSLMVQGHELNERAGMSLMVQGHWFKGNNAIETWTPSPIFNFLFIFRMTHQDELCNFGIAFMFQAQEAADFSKISMECQSA